MATALCERALAHLSERGPDDPPCVLYVGVGTRAHAVLPLQLPSGEPAHRSVVLQFGDSTGYDTGSAAAPGAAEGARLRVDGDRALGATAAPLPVVDSADFYADGPMGRLLDYVIDDCGGAVVILCSDSTETSTTTPPAFRYLHLARAVYQRTKTHAWTTVPDGKAGVYMRAVTLFAGVDVHSAASGPGYSLVYPANGACERVYIDKLSDFELRLDLGRLWLYVPCSTKRDPRDVACDALRRGERHGARRHAPSPVVTTEGLLGDVQALTNRIELLRNEDPAFDGGERVDDALATLRAALTGSPGSAPAPSPRAGLTPKGGKSRRKK